MRGKSLALLVLALGCGLVASLGITQVLAKRGDQTAQGDMTSVYLAKTDIGSGALATGENLKIEQWPRDKAPAGALVRQEDVDGRRARCKIYAGQPLMDAMLLPKGELPVDAQIPKGLRVVALPVGIEAIQGGLVLPGSRCDLQVFIRADPSIGVTETLSKTILQDIRVFAVNDVTTTESSDPKEKNELHSIPTGKTVSLLVTPAQAEVVTLASQLGSIKLILRSAEDSEQVKCSPMRPLEMLGMPNTKNRDKEKVQPDDTFNMWVKMIQDTLKRSASASKPVKSEEQVKYTVRVRSGSNVTDVLLIANASPNGLPINEDAWTATNLPPQSTHAARAVDASSGVSPDAGLPVKPSAEAPLPVPKVISKPPMGA